MDTGNGVWTSNGSHRVRALNNPDVVSVRSSAPSSILRSAGKASVLHSNFVGVQSRFRRKYYHKTVVALLILLILVLLIVVIILATKKKPDSVCSSKECLRIGAGLLYAMDTTIDPCEDFYQFTCGNWALDHPKPDSVTSNDWFREAQAKTLRIIREFLRSDVNDTQPYAVAKSKIMYQACMDVKLMDKLSLSPLLSYLKKFDLPDIPSSLNITLPGEKNIEHSPFNWITSLVKIKKYMGLDLIIGFDIFPDPVNRSVNKIAVGTPETESPLPFNDESHVRLRKAKKKLISLSEEDHSEEEASETNKNSTEGLSAYVSYIQKVISIIVVYLYPEISSDDISLVAGELALDAIKITKKLYKIQEEAENTTKSSINPLDDLLYITVTDLQNQTDKLISPRIFPIWDSYIQLIMSDNKDYNLSEELILTSKTDITYLQLVTELLSDMSKSRLEFYIWLSVVEELILHTTSAFRQLHIEYMKLIIEIEGNTPRSMYCANGINNLMGMAVSYILADDEFIENSLPKVHDMIFYIREAFNDLVKSTSWMDTATKKATLEKSAAMRSLIGFPDWIKNRTVLDQFYDEVAVSNKTHLDNMMSILTWQMEMKIREFKEESEFGWATSPSNVNAFHTFQSNTITIPIAILQYPFYNLGLEALNYGAIGTILGHELTHGFDDSGRMYDRSGNMRQWWSNDTILEYVNRTECFIEQYGHYTLSDIGESVDGELTLGENIADNGGLREAFYAYRKYVKKFGKEKKLPGLENFSHEQLFFISFGNLWCETLTPAASRYALEDSHCPGSIRLKGVLSNSQEFANTFKCKRGSGMFPHDNRCRIW